MDPIRKFSQANVRLSQGQAAGDRIFALLDEEFPVIILNMDQTHRAKTLNCYQEVSSRNSPVVIITNDISIKEEVNCDVIYIPENKSYSSLLGIIPIQLLAYNLSINKGINPDKPGKFSKGSCCWINCIILCY